MSALASGGMKMLVKISTVLLLLVGCSGFDSIAQPLVPSVISILAPDPGLDRSIAAFSGAWGGQVGGVAVVMVVEEVGPRHANVVYAWDDAPRFGAIKGNSRFVATVAKREAAELEFGTSRVKRYAKMNSDLSGVDITAVLPSGTSTGTLRRLDAVPKSSSARTPDPASVPVPSDVPIAVPADSIPGPIRAFSGRWFGTWDDLLDHVLVVEKFESPEQVTVVYGWGTAPAWNIHQAGFTRTPGRIVEGRLEFKLANGAVVTYAPLPGGELAGRWQLGNAFARSRMVRLTR